MTAMRAMPLVNRPESVGSFEVGGDHGGVGSQPTDVDDPGVDGYLDQPSVELIDGRGTAPGRDLSRGGPNGAGRDTGWMFGLSSPQACRAQEIADARPY